MKSLLGLLLFSVVVAVAVATAPMLHADSPTVVPDEYIVIFQKNTTTEIHEFHINALKQRLSNEFVEERIINTYYFGEVIGYAAVLSQKNLAIEREHPNVLYVEANQVVTAYPEGTTTQSAGVPWGIERVSKRNLGFTGQYTYFTSSGTGVVAYVVDTGILISHNEFEGRAKFGVNYAAGQNDDCNGHGTHVAGTIGGKTYGVAKKVTLVAVKVLNCQGSGTNANVISGIQWTATDHKSRTNGRSVANLSLGGAASTTVDNAIASAISGGVSFAVAAGNDNANACNYSPARAPGAITVGATANTDARSTFSNFGTCVDVFAPGTSILSAWIGSNSATSTISGTSMASPHVAGVVAVRLGNLLADGLPNPSVTVVHDWVASIATPNKVTSPGTGSPNLLAFSPSSY